MNKLLTTIAAIAAITITAQARIGETLEQAINRYGQPIDTARMKYTDDPMYRFSKGDFFISVALDGMLGQIYWIEYVRKGACTNKYDWDAEMSDTEKLNFLNANRGEPWTRCDTFSEAWRNRELSAFYSFKSGHGDHYHALTIVTDTMSQKWDGAKAKVETENQQGF